VESFSDSPGAALCLLQIMLMGGTILGPGTIFLMLVGAFVAAFHIDNWTSFEYNIVPILFFMFICFICKSEIQVSWRRN
jgi:chitin synthase